KNPRVSTGMMVMNASCVATRWEDADSERGRFIFRGDKDLLWVVNDGKKTYEQIDKAFVDQVAAQMTDMRAQMQEQLAKLPPEQPAQAEEMMKKFGGAMQNMGTALKLDYRKTAETRTINGQLCTRFDTYWGDDLISCAWVAPYSAMKLTPEDASAFTKMGEFVSKMTGSLGKVQKEDFIPMHELGGIPLLTQELSDGKVTKE